MHVLAQVPGSQFRFKRSRHWSGGDLYAGNPKWDVMFFIVANTVGISQYVKPDALQAGFAAASSEIGNVCIRVKVPALSTGRELDDEPAFRLPKGFTKVQVIKTNMPVPWAHTSFMPDFQLHFPDHTMCKRRWDPDHSCSVRSIGRYSTL